MEVYILPYVKEIASGNKWWILTDSCHVESESISIPFLYCYMKIHCSVLYFEQIFYPCMIL